VFAGTAIQEATVAEVPFVSVPQGGFTLVTGRSYDAFSNTTGVVDLVPTAFTTPIVALPDGTLAMGVTAEEGGAVRPYIVTVSPTHRIVFNTVPAAGDGDVLRTLHTVQVPPDWGTPDRQPARDAAASLDYALAASLTAGQRMQWPVQLLGTYVDTGSGAGTELRGVRLQLLQGALPTGIEALDAAARAAADASVDACGGCCGAAACAHCPAGRTGVFGVGGGMRGPLRGPHASVPSAPLRSAPLQSVPFAEGTAVVAEADLYTILATTTPPMDSRGAVLEPLLTANGTLLPLTYIITGPAVATAGGVGGSVLARDAVTGFPGVRLDGAPASLGTPSASPRDVFVRGGAVLVVGSRHDGAAESGAMWSFTRDLFPTPTAPFPALVSDAPTSAGGVTPPAASRVVAAVPVAASTVAAIVVDVAAPSFPLLMMLVAGPAGHTGSSAIVDGAFAPATADTATLAAVAPLTTFVQGRQGFLGHFSTDPRDQPLVPTDRDTPFAPSLARRPAFLPVEVVGGVLRVSFLPPVKTPLVQAGARVVTVDTGDASAAALLRVHGGVHFGTVDGAGVGDVPAGTVEYDAGTNKLRVYTGAGWETITSV
jgi:hypothetical protein